MSTPDRGQSKTLLTINKCGSKIARISVFDCYLLALWLIIAMEKSVFNEPRSTFIDSINVFDCHLSSVFIEYNEYVAKTIPNKS